MTKFTLPKPGTEISVKWSGLGPWIKVEGSNAELAVTLAFINGKLARACGFPEEALKTAAEVGPGMFDLLSRGAVVVDMKELKRQAKEESHEDP